MGEMALFTCVLSQSCETDTRAYSITKSTYSPLQNMQPCEPTYDVEGLLQVVGVELTRLLQKKEISWDLVVGRSRGI